ncbi:hypothetical protein MiSe_75230 [Microseira wollei NIES-4236]|uniref:Uncharacterized protein n=1 Tax=Microseira wollei NIES-4236 TaxID=2530354 RepID=A0AAV3XNL6_9CYAN|nr:hypothetical protein MiSe_75230 [Microseira wollei NIES-4236]
MGNRPDMISSSKLARFWFSPTKVEAPSPDPVTLGLSVPSLLQQDLKYFSPRWCLCVAGTHTYKHGYELTQTFSRLSHIYCIFGLYSVV